MKSAILRKKKHNKTACKERSGEKEKINGL